MDKLIKAQKMIAQLKKAVNAPSKRNVEGPVVNNKFIDLPNKKNKGGSMKYIHLYYISKNGNKVTVEHFPEEDVAIAKEHLQQLRKLYGKYVQFGTEDKVGRVIR